MATPLKNFILGEPFLFPGSRVPQSVPSWFVRVILCGFDIG